VQDVPQFGPLALTMGGQMVNDPLFVPEILKHVGPVAFVDWFVHFVGLGAYTALNLLGDATVPMCHLRSALLWVSVIRHAATCCDVNRRVMNQGCSWHLIRL
jgi:hypothetical protein